MRCDRSVRIGFERYGRLGWIPLTSGKHIFGRAMQLGDL
jgi:hypothetical protein